MPRERLPFGTHGTITLTKTKAGTWQASTYYRGLDGVRRRLRRTASTRTRAEIALREYAAVILAASGTVLSPHSTVADAVRVWWDEWNEEREHPAGTISRYRILLDKHLLPRFGDLRLLECTPSLIQAHLSEAAKSTGAPTLKVVRSLLGQVFDTAIRHDAIARNPAKATKGINPAKKPVQVLSMEQVQQLRACFTGAPMGLDVLVEILLGTGARIGEALGMCWEDLERRGDGVVWHVAGTVIRDSGRVYKQEHRKHAQDLAVWLPEFVIEALCRHAGGAWGSLRGPVLPHPAHGGYMDRMNIARQWDRALKGSGIEWVRPHALRKTVATLLVRESGVSAGAAQLGNTEAILAKHYVAHDPVAPDSTAILEALSP